MSNERLVIIDGHAILHRAWHALPPLKTKTGEMTNAVYGFTLVFLKILKELKPDYLAVTFDLKGPTFRHQLFKAYKAQRAKQPDEFYAQIERVKEILKSFRVTYLERPGYEADDLIGSLCQFIAKSQPSVTTIIVTGDLDTLQLVNERTKVYTFKKGITDSVLYDLKTVKERFGLLPEQLLDFKALRGDPADNIPGVKGIGEKTALTLIKQFQSLENLYKNLAKVENERTRKLLKENKESAFLSKKLMTLKKDLKLPFKWENLKLTQPEKTKVVKIFQVLEFNSLLTRVLHLFAKEETESMTKENYHCLETEEEFFNFLDLLQKQKVFAFDTETTGLDTFSARLLGLSFSWQEGEAYYLPFKNEEKWKLEKIKPSLENPRIKKIGHNLKYDLKILNHQGIKLAGLDFDTMIAGYLLNPGARVYGLDWLVFSELGYQMTTLESLIGKGRKQIPIEAVPLENLARYACQDADYTFRLSKRLASKFKFTKLFSLFQQVEMPLVSVLAKMEDAGVKINQKILTNLLKEADEKNKILETKIYKLAGSFFNINSPQQLKEILFQKLKISAEGIAKTKTGLSTAAPELEKLKNKHQIIGLISQYREMSKLKSTYLEALPKLINEKTGRLHTNFNQTITATGRLSSSDPNLQNIPIRSEFGRKIRQAFVAEKGYQLISADYSQIELRIAASLAKEQKMVSAFQKGEDIHTQTASEVKNLPPEKVTPAIRRLAKMINFGIIYGLGAQGLAEGAEITKEEANYFIKKYFSVYPALKKYIEKIKEFARRHGYIETLFGRRRYLPEINSPIQVLRAEAERMAINLPIQGLASDLIKIAMIEIDKKISPFGLAAKMILQVHDELVFEVKQEKVLAVVKIVKEIMENPPVKLLVPIKVEIKIGPNWGEL